MTHAQAAKAMGMKTREIRDVADRPGGGYLVTTFDGARCEVLAGKAAPLAEPSPAGAEEQPAGAEAGVAAKPGKQRGGRGKKVKDAEPVDVYPAGGDVAARLAWVGDRADRAAAALEVEQDRDNPDADLVAQLQQLAAGAATG